MHGVESLILSILVECPALWASGSEPIGLVYSLYTNGSSSICKSSRSTILDHYIAVMNKP